ncbi:phospholipase D family protein [Candidatus Omnitrophota bacterium]
MKSLCRQLHWIANFTLLIVALVVYITPGYCYDQSRPFSRFIQETKQKKNHYLNVLNLGDDALLARIHLIRYAQKSINIQTFHWDIDETSRYFIYELIEAAKRGVQVKIIVDCNTLPKAPKLYAFIAAAHPNFRIKVYNPLTEKIRNPKAILAIEALMDFRSVNQRMHNKLFIIDGEIGITGGRNYANDYYDRGKQRNFRDCDLLIIGPVVNQMTNSFLEYWEHPLVVDSRDMLDVRKLIDNKDYPEYKDRDSFQLRNSFDDIDRCALDEECIKSKFIDHHYMVKQIDFFADQPGKIEKLGKDKVSRTTYELSKLIQSAKKSIVMQTPYLVIGRENNKFYKNLRKDNPDIEILVSSNSLAAADHTHAYAFSYKNKKKYIKNFRWQIFELKPSPKDADKMISPVTGDSRSEDYHVCIHAKSYVVDQEKVWVGSFNLDPRSANLNTEVGVIIYDAQVAQVIEQDIRRDMANHNSWTIAKRRNVPIGSFVGEALGTVVDSVPIVKVWPFTYSGSYELREGKEAVSIFHDDFYNHYKYVGPFPGVQGTGKEIEARLLKAFFGPIEPLI